MRFVTFFDVLNHGHSAGEKPKTSGLRGTEAKAKEVCGECSYIFSLNCLLLAE